MSHNLPAPRRGIPGSLILLSFLTCLLTGHPANSQKLEALSGFAYAYNNSAAGITVTENGVFVAGVYNNNSRYTYKSGLFIHNNDAVSVQLVDTTCTSANGGICGGIASDDEGNLFAAFYSASYDSIWIGPEKYPGQTAYLLKYAPDGTLLDVIQEGAAAGLAITADQKGNIVIAGMNYTRRFTTDGQLNLQIPGGDDCVATDVNGNIYFTTKCYSYSGALKWTRAIPTTQYDKRSVACDRQGNNYLSHTWGDSSYVKKYDSTGKLIWTCSLKQSEGGYALAVNDRGEVLSAGTRYIPEDGGASQAVILTKIGTSGSSVWQYTSPVYKYHRFEPEAIAFRGNEIHVTGSVRHEDASEGFVLQVLDDVTGTNNDIENEPQVEVIPDPRGGGFFIRAHEGIEFIVSDMMGKLQAVTRLNAVELKTTGLTPGLYVITPKNQPQFSRKILVR